MNKATLFFLLALLSFSGLLMFLTSSVRAWQTSISDCQGCGSRAQAVVVDAAGDILVIGDFFDGSDVVKLSEATGSVIWRYEVMGHESRNHAQAIAIDSHGDVFVVFSYTRVVVKVSGANGTQIWRKPIGGTLNALLPIINAVAVDLNDNVVTAGTMGGFFNVCKLDGQTGDEKWHYDVRGGIAKAVAVDPFGNIAAAGIMNANFAVLKLQGENGAELWQRELNGAGNFSGDVEEANAVAMDKDGSVVAAGVTSNEDGNFRDFTVAKYLPDGRTKWIETVDGRYISENDRGERFRQSNDIAYAVTIDKAGNVIAAGSIQEDDYVPRFRNDPEHFEVVKIGRDGGVKWNVPAEDHIIGEEYISGHAFAVSVDDADDVVAGGVHDGHFTVVKFRSATGEKTWQPYQLNSGGLGNGNNALSVVTDAARNVVAAGEIIGSDGWQKFTVIKVRGTDGTDYFANPTPTPTVPETVLKYAPLVYLYPNEKYWPEDPLTFINNSSLNWFHEGGCGSDPLAARGTIQPGRLGIAAITPYTDRPDFSTCAPIPNILFSAHDYTRPWDGQKRNIENSFWNDLFYEKEGFYLDQDDNESARQGIRDLSGGPIYRGAPVYYEYVPGEYVTYWFFYAYDQFQVDLLPDQAHEGDWERISIQLTSTDTPIRVHYYQHKGGDTFNWSDVLKDGNHVNVFSAKGSHASYPIASGPLAGFPTHLGFSDHTDYGPQWRTWESLLDVTKQSWYGYGGAWGQVSTTPKIETPFGSISGDDFTGPLGPFRYKNSVETWFKKIEGSVTDTKGNWLTGVTVTLTNSKGVVLVTVFTNAAGLYSFEHLRFGDSNTVFPTKQGYTFSPAIETFTKLTENQTLNFIGKDMISPTLNLPPNISVNADLPQGATVYYTVSATDNVTQSPRIACTRPSGALFPIGTNTIACTATDDAGNSSNGTFKIIVKGSTAQISDLITLVKDFNLPNGIENSLLIKLQNALAEAKAGHACIASNQLKAFISEAQAQSGKKISPAQANQMLTTATRIRTVIGC